MKEEFLNLIDFKRIETLLQSYYESTGFAVSILDLDGNVLANSDWQIICRDFHRVNPDSCKRCLESDRVLASKMRAGEKFHFYTCLNGLVDVVVPIMIDDIHVANLYSGQFLFEEPDRDVFIKQAETFGFNKEKYLEALADVPVVPRERARKIMSFLAQLTVQISEMALQKLNQEKLIAGIRENEAKYMDLFEHSPVMMANVDHMSGIVVDCNQTLCEKTGYSKDEIVGKHVLERYFIQEESQPSFELISKTGTVRNAVLKLDKKEGGYIDVLLNVTSVKDPHGNFLYSRSAWQDISERIKAESTLNDERERWRRLFNNSIFGIAICRVIRDSHGTPVDFIHIELNDAVEKNTGFKADQILGKRVKELLPEEEAEYFVKLYGGVTDTGVPIQLEQWFDLYERVLDIGVVRIDEEHFALSFIDITERRRAEQKLLASETRHAHLAANIPGVVYQYLQGDDPTKAEFPFISSGVRNLYGLEPEEVLQDSQLMWDAMFPDDIPGFIESINLAMKAGSKWEHEWRIRTKTGELKWISGAATQETQEDGKRLWDGLLLDITKRKQAEQALRKSEEKYRVLIENAEVFVSLYDREGNCLLMNRKVADAFGGTPVEFEGRNLVDLHPEAGSEYFKRIHDVVSSGVPRTYEDVVHFPTGERYLHSNVQPVLDGSGVIYAVQIVSQDVTEARKLQQQLQQSQKMEAIGRLAGGIAHDFNNVLTVISNYSSFLLDELPDHSPMHTDVNEIHSAANQAAELTKQLLAFSRKQIIQPSVIDVNDTLSRSENMFRRLIGEDVELSFLYGNDLDPVEFDPGQIEQILFNLVANSRDAMPDGGKLTFETRSVEIDPLYLLEHPEAVSGRHVMIAVSDTGHGMDAETCRNAFEPFFTTKSHGKGTGLGLSTVYGIVRQHGGHLEVYSEPGLGTTFKIYIPGSDKPAEDSDTTGNSETHTGNETILLIEDNPVVRKLTERILNRKDYQVIEAEHGEDAIRKIQMTKQHIHLVLTDVIMPGLSGRECFEKLRQIRPELKVLYMSGYTEDAIAKKGVLDSGTHFIQKPFNSKTLAEKIREVLDK